MRNMTYWSELTHVEGIGWEVLAAAHSLHPMRNITYWSGLTHVEGIGWEVLAAAHYIR